MTIQVMSFGESKQKLQEALNSRPREVVFEDPSIMTPGVFTGEGIRKGESFLVVMDPKTRRRFATVKRLESGEFRVM